jgi:hypothetical protein
MESFLSCKHALLGVLESERSRFPRHSEHKYVALSGIYPYLGDKLGLQTSTDLVKTVESLTSLNGAQKISICCF